MICKFDFCIYNRKSACLLSRIAIDENGLCAERSNISMPKEVIEKLKSEERFNLIIKN